MIEIPLKPKNDDEFTTLKKGDKEIIVYAVLCQADNQTAFVRFHPEYAIQVGKTTSKYALSEVGKRECKNFWSYPKNRAYREAYEATLAEFLGRKSAPKSEIVGEIDESRKDKALKSLLNQAMSLVEGSGDLDAETLKIAAEIFKKVGLLKDEETQVEPARRYIPVRCLSECAYRHFVESHVENGDIISECDYCQTRKFAEEKGWRFDPTKNLDLPINNSNGNKPE